MIVTMVMACMIMLFIGIGIHLKCEGLSHLLRLTDASGFDDDGINFASDRHLGQLDQKVFPQCTTDATVVHFHHGLLILDEFGVLNQGSINVECSHVIDQHGHYKV